MGDYGISMDHLQQTKQEFTRQAAGFAASAATTDSRLTQRLIEAAGASATQLALDVACGPGIVTAALAGNVREVVAFDLTPEMLARAHERCAKAGLRNVTFKEGSATDLPFPDDHFDIVVTRLSIHHFQEPRRVLNEMRRVMKNDGTLVVADVVSSEITEKSALQNVIEVLRDPSHVRMHSASQLASLICDAGLTIQKEDTWDQPREFEEWGSLVAFPERIDPLRTIVRSLASVGEDAGMGLSLAGGSVVFFHRWYMIVARKS
jgi:ubiquinone/menaquinone biosynthesis C-methylase UbiE